MKARKYWLFGMVLVVCGASVISLQLFADTDVNRGVDEILRRNPLVGLEGVAVGIAIDADLNKHAKERYGLTHDRLRTFVGLQLGRNGIPVLTPSAYQATKGLPRLEVYCWADTLLTADQNDTAASPADANPGIPVAVFYMRVMLYEDARLVRNGVYVQGVTWEMLWRGRIHAEKLKDHIEDAIEHCLRAFCYDYLAANSEGIRDYSDNSLYVPTEPNKPKVEDKR
ncbi:MAG: hypothetical protein ACYSTF_01100 [Planctomycetota bacterium]|jgi:hypothetical protein